MFVFGFFTTQVKSGVIQAKSGMIHVKSGMIQVNSSMIFLKSGMIFLKFGMIQVMSGELPAGFLDELLADFSSKDVWTSDAAFEGGDSETSGLATNIVWGVGAKTFAFDAALEGGGTETDCTSDAAYASCLFMLELNSHSGSSIYSSELDE
ncbi:hypothetical protein F2Q69_00027313 [Brassica cretica]|uniref:Uncharacterized protein n=1 Tax=Brassica cretica TaxID=69181 RepID=A0A8S9S2J6_BRACR|nr:hypothetical protein F2Q69_00027313 [Brassica cretica]